MNSEPLYTYKPGKGWVINPEGDHIVTMKCGTRVRLVARPPKNGETYDLATEGEHWGTQKSPNWDEWEKWFARKAYANWITASSNRQMYSGEIYMTAVPL